MKKLKLTISFIVIVMLSSCASMYMQDPYLKISKGMTKQEVIAALGNPTDRSFEAEYETWYYKNDLKVVTFRNNIVESLITDQEEIDRQHEIEKARAGSTKINIGNNERLRQTESRHPLPCAESNFNGKFAKGGGCNTFGCWPPGGSCNTFGCTMTGECTVSGGCPQEIETYKCRMRATY